MAPSGVGSACSIHPILRDGPRSLTGRATSEACRVRPRAGRGYVVDVRSRVSLVTSSSSAVSSDTSPCLDATSAFARVQNAFSSVRVSADRASFAVAILSDFMRIPSADAASSTDIPWDRSRFMPMTRRSTPLSAPTTAATTIPASRNLAVARNAPYVSRFTTWPTNSKIAKVLYPPTNASTSLIVILRRSPT